MDLQKEEQHFHLVRHYIAVILWGSAAIMIDQITKYFAMIQLKGSGPIALIEGVFELQYLENRGMAFGMLQDKQILFVIGAAVICGAILFYYRKIPDRKKYMPIRICSVLLIAGAIGNLIDRVRFNYVIDFFYFKLIDFPIFNVADCYVVAACASFAVLILFYYKEDSDFDFIHKSKTSSVNK